MATEYKEALGSKLGDELKFDIAGETLEVTISSFRKVKWDSMQPNFFLMFPPGLLEGAAGHLHDQRAVPADGSRARSRSWCGASRACRSSTWTTCCAGALHHRQGRARRAERLPLHAAGGVVVLLAAVQATRDERRYESAMLRTLGASRRTVLIGVLAEFALIGVLPACSPRRRRRSADYFLATRVLEIPYHARPWAVVHGARRAARCWSASPAGLRRAASLSQPPLATLRQLMNGSRRCDAGAMTGWFDPGVMAQSATMMATANIFGRHSDTRLIEALGSQPQGELRLLAARARRFLVDYVADLGDGWNPTYAIADAMARAELAFAESTRRMPDRVLVMGGDQVYPYPSREAYARAHRDAVHGCVRGSRAARRLRDSRQPRLVRQPDRVLAPVLPARARLRRLPTRQTRSYFALQLPRDWWLLGIDLQLGADLDEPQVRYFQQVAARMRRAARRDPLRAGAAVESRRCYPRHSSLRRTHSSRISRDEVLPSQGRVHSSPATCTSTSATLMPRACRRSFRAAAARSCIRRTRPRPGAAQGLRAAGGYPDEKTSRAPGLAQSAVPLPQSEGRLAVRDHLRAVRLAGLGAPEAADVIDLPTALRSALQRGGA